ncbi:Iron hydrogenase 1 [Tritrichomonas foetus]|uniref:Iron hydrogenase 1 n=1 Tax=Tritrichomonas foetus TaxID=1144522 RepID=A0A1J4K861_9EUKA|nr:Iron hydrogenase 1 [Tritrichomonas foetus]|eukprot:OHT07591.1 Iron hydrogenase 1 [Tritrichomonas foetus]
MCYDQDVSTQTHHSPIPESVDVSTNSIRIDPSKCVDCKRCVRACKNIAGQKVLKVGPLGDHPAAIQTTNGKPLQETNCIKCGQCTLYCPVGAITENSQVREVMSSIKNHQRKAYVCQINPSVHIALADAFGVSPSVLTPGKVASALRIIGFDKVYDTRFGGDILIMEEAAQLVERLKDKKSNSPFLASACPAFINYIEQSRSPFIPNLSTARSAPAILASLIREVLPQQLNLHPEDIYSVYVTTCLAKKDEIERPTHSSPSGVKDTDVSLSIRELIELFRQSNINVHELEESKFDFLLGGTQGGEQASGAAAILDTAGGLMEAVLRTANWMLTGKSPKNLEMKALRGDKAQKVTEVQMGDIKFQVAAVQGMANAMKLFDKIKKDKKLKEIKYIEVMACQGGCVCGGGSVMPADKDAMNERVKAVYEDDKACKVRCAHESSAVTDLYQNFLEKPNSHKAHDLLHTHFAQRPGF